MHHSHACKMTTFFLFDDDLCLLDFIIMNVQTCILADALKF